MPAFPKPKFSFEYNVSAEIARLRAHKRTRGVPDRTDSRILVATWNLANLGAQERRDQDKALITEVLSWFDIIAVQECRENFADLEDLQRKLGPSTRMLMSDAAGNDERLTFLYDASRFQLLEEIGEPPLPPYIRRTPGADLTRDRERYQTVFAAKPGSIAAPTAGLHFTDRVLERLRQRSIPICEVLLHVGYGTFKPVRSQEIEDHKLDPEYYEISHDSAGAIRANLEVGKRLVAVGTTTTRTVEHLARGGSFPGDGVSGYTDLFIFPGFEFRVVGGLLTNFHLPKSTLLMLVCAFAGRELMHECYRLAVKEKYRFYSYGDSMLIL